MLASLRKDYDNYAEAKLAHDAQVELISKENKKALSEYENQIKSRKAQLAFVNICK